MKLATPTFLTGPKDDLATADVYGVTSGEVINNLAGAFSTMAADTAAKLRNATGIDGQLAAVLDDVKRGTLDPTQLQERLKTIVQDAGTNLSALSDDLKATALDNLAATAGIDGNQLRYMIDGTENVADGIDRGEAEALIRTLGEMVGESDLFWAIDLGAETALFSAYLSQAIDLGLDAVLEVLYEEASDETVVAKISLDNLLPAVKKSNLPLVSKLLNRIGVGRALSRYPELASQLLEHYRYPRQEDLDYQGQYDQLVTLLVDLHPNFPVVETNTAMTTLTPFATASQDASDLLINRVPTSQFRVEAMIAQSDHLRGLDALATRAFPGVAL